MEPLFINRYVRDEAVYQEMLLYYLYKQLPLLVLHGLLAFSFLINVISLIVGLPVWPNLLIFAVAEAVIFLSFRLRLSTAVKRDKETFGESPTVTFEVTERGIRCSANGQLSAEVPFDQFRHATETKHLILLTSKARLLYIFRKDGFTQGTAAEFNQFLCSKKIRFK